MLHYFFGWYQGSVWANIIADVLWVPIVFLGGKIIHTSLKKHIDNRHEELKAHITKVIKKGTK